MLNQRNLIKNTLERGVAILTSGKIDFEAKVEINSDVT